MPSRPPKRQKTGAAKTEKKKGEKKSTQLYNKLKLEGHHGRRIPENWWIVVTTSHRRNLWADAFWNAGCRAMGEIAADEHAAASPAEHHNPLTHDPPPRRRPLDINVAYTHNYDHNIHSSPSSRLSAKARKQWQDQERREQLKWSLSPPLASAAPWPRSRPPLSYIAENIGDLIRDWDSGTKLQMGGVHVPLKYWYDLYARHRGYLL